MNDNVSTTHDFYTSLESTGGLMALSWVWTVWKKAVDSVARTVMKVARKVARKALSDAGSV
jgi:hypothetical protein